MSDMEIEPLRELDDGPLMGFYARGHHDLADFLRAMLEYVVEEGYEDMLPFRKRGPGFYPRLKVWDVSLLWWRAVPWRGEDTELRQAEPNSLGAFKVTSWEVPW